MDFIDDSTDASQPGCHGAGKEYAEASETQKDVVLLVQLGQTVEMELCFHCRHFQGMQAFWGIAGDIVSICRGKSRSKTLACVLSVSEQESCQKKDGGE